MNNMESSSYVYPFFAAANSQKGFVSFYDGIFANERIERRYIIKGGPGTGKSSFMKRVAEDARRLGLDVEHYRCSSDPTSLDGIIIDGRIALIDGTAPHVADTELAGARDDIIDLGAFWNSSSLARRRADIEALALEKSECYRRAYSALAACGAVFDIERSLVNRAIRYEKLTSSAERTVCAIGKGSRAETRIGLIDSVGMKGRVRFDSYERMAKRVWVIDNSYRTGHIYLSALKSAGIANGCPMRVSYDPVHVTEPNAIYFCHTGDCFVLAHGESDIPVHSRINMKRFLSDGGIREIRCEWRSNEKIYDSLHSLACDELKKAGDAHFKLEAIYVEAMDFTAQNAFCESFLKKYTAFL